MTTELRRSTDLRRFTYEFDTTGDFGQFKDFEIRVVTIEEKPWFVAVDVATLLGYVNTNQTIIRHCKHTKSLKELSRGTKTVPLQITTKLIPESDLYRLVMRSDMPEAERFQDWVCEEVLPAIREHGAYMTPDTLEKSFEDPNFLIALVEKLKKTQVERDGALEREAEAIRTKGKITKGQLAKTMQTAGVLSKRNKKLQAENAELKKDKSQYFSAAMILDDLEIQRLYKIKGEHSYGLTAGVLGKFLSPMCKEIGFPVKREKMSRFYVNLYHVDAIEYFKSLSQVGDVPSSMAYHLKRKES